MSHWSKIKEQGAGYWRLQASLKIYQIFGKKTLRLLLYPIVFCIFIFAPKVRNYSRLYLTKIYQIKKSAGDNSFKKPNFIAVFKHIFSFAESLLDRVDSWSGNMELRKLNIKNPQELDEVFAEIDKKNGPFFVCSHLGNVEVLRALAYVKSDKKLVVNSLVQTSQTPDFNNLLQKINPDFSLNLISAANIGVDSVIEIKEKLQNGEIVVSAGDRTASGNQNKFVKVNFLGDEAKFPVGTFTLASLMDSKIYFVFCLKSEAEDAYDFYLYKSKIDFTSRAHRKENLEKIVREYVSYLETLCLKHPYQWHNFFDFWGKQEIN